MASQGVYRVDWYPGSDQLLGTCHCGATLIAEDPIEIWQWLLAHPRGHHAGTDRAGSPASRIGAVVQAVPA